MPRAQCPKRHNGHIASAPWITLPQVPAQAFRPRFGASRRSCAEGAAMGMRAFLLRRSTGVSGRERRANPGVDPSPASAVTVHRRLVTLTNEECRACGAQRRKPPNALPHPRLMIVSSGPMVEAYGGGVETRYVCLDCGHSVSHSTGRWGEGWH
jgi:hypothetical protein